MNNQERYNQLLEEAYQNYKKSIIKMLESWDAKYHKKLHTDADGCREYSKEKFIQRIKTDQEFSNTWGVRL